MTRTPPKDRPDRSDYQVPRHTPHPDDTPLDPYQPRELQQEEPETEFKRPLMQTAKQIRTTEAQLRRYLSQIGKPKPNDLRDVSLNPQRAMVMNPAQAPATRRAKTAQQNLETHYRRWADLSEKHLRSIPDEHP